MRFFRVPSFTGIEAHRDDADRGSLRIVEGCVPHGPGGIRSGPIWEKVGEFTAISNGEDNNVHALDDGLGNSVVAVSRFGKVHDITVLSKENTEITSFGSQYDVAVPSNYISEKAFITPIGDNMYAFGDGSKEAVYISTELPESKTTFASATDLYDQDLSIFPNCKFYVQGPKKTIFASGNPEDPLVVYISESSGMSQPHKNKPYSTEESAHIGGDLSKVQILASNANKITALSTRNEQVVVHTDKGCHILYAPKPDQAETGYRVEQAPSTNLSASVNQQVVGGQGGTQPFWLGHDSQVYKDESAKRGAEDFKAYADPVQANWKAKGQWEKEHPVDLTDSFATYDPQSGMYWVYMRSNEFIESISGIAPGVPTVFQSIKNSPGIPSGFESSIVHEPPLAPTIIRTEFTPDPPLIPRNFDAEWIRPPDAPSSLESSSLLEPSTPTFFSKGEFTIDAGKPTNFEIKSTVFDPPLVPSNLGFGEITPDAPEIPQSFQISNFQRDPLFEFTFPSSWDGTTVGEHRKKIFEYAGYRIQRIITDTLTVEIDVQEVDIDGSGGIWGSAGVTNYVPQGMEKTSTTGWYTFNYARPTNGIVRIDTNDIANLDYSNDPVFGLPSLYFVAMHELLHCLGLGNWWYNLNDYPDNADTFLNQHNPQSRPRTQSVPIPIVDSQGNITGTRFETVVDEDIIIDFKEFYQFKYIFGFDSLKSIPNDLCEQYNGTYGKSGYKWYFEQEAGVNNCLGSLPILDNHLYDFETPNVPSYGGLYTEQIPSITENTTYQQTSCYLYAGVAITYPCFRKEIFTGTYSTGDTRYISKITAGMLEDIGYNVDYSQIDQIPANSFGTETINSNCTFGLSPQQATEGMETNINSGSVNSITKPL